MTVIENLIVWQFVIVILVIRSSSVNSLTITFTAHVINFLKEIAMIFLDYAPAHSGVLPVDFSSDFAEHSVSHVSAVDFHAMPHEAIKAASGPSGLGSNVLGSLIATLALKGLDWTAGYIQSLNQGGSPTYTDPLGNNS